MKFFIFFTLIIFSGVSYGQAEAQDLRMWKISTAPMAYALGGYSLEISRTMDPKLDISFMYQARRSVGWEGTPKPTELFHLSFRYFKQAQDKAEGFYFGGALTHTNRIQEKQGDLALQRKSSIASYMILAGWQWYFGENDSKVFRLGGGYGPGAPYIGNIDPKRSNAFNDIFDYSYLDIAIGFAFF